MAEAFGWSRAIFHELDASAWISLSIPLATHPVRAWDTPCVRLAHPACAWHTLRALSTHPACAQHTPCVRSAHTLRTLSTHPACAQHTPCVRSAHTLRALSTHPACAWHTPKSLVFSSIPWLTSLSELHVPKPGRPSRWPMPLTLCAHACSWGVQQVGCAPPPRRLPYGLQGGSHSDSIAVQGESECMCVRVCVVARALAG